MRNPAGAACGQRLGAVVNTVHERPYPVAGFAQNFDGGRPGVAGWRGDQEQLLGRHLVS
jgi:hypothetical protein